ncbi:adenylyltransferase/cytidyltransferase family protein [Patescibacteria group bacterium]|nr:adenylyltransferase/cytidyltransferase family protein [Patescibacteria group bacterium]
MEKLIVFTKRAKRQKKKIVLVTGVFDLLHQEHKSFLIKAKTAGDVLIVGIESDKRVKKIKGTHRPVHNERERLQQLVFLPQVDLAFVLPEKFSTTQDHLALLKLIRPQVLAVSSHTPYLESKRQLMAQVGGEVRVVYQQRPSVSTTQILSKPTT